ncbi:MAG: peptidoglycan DD-metalloendopeptidase family protein [Gammaproteobacteria bacterium]|nr:peptidoglycan DD-metalloendopeptidase family protein [Gammaproteobacteria bacterium]
MLTKDFNNSWASKRASKRAKRHHLSLLAIIGTIIGTISLLSPSDRAEANRQLSPDVDSLSHIQGDVLSLKLPRAILPNIVERNPLPAKPSTWQSVEVKKGDNLSQIFDTLKLPPQQLAQLVRTDKSMGKYLSALRPKQTIRFQIDNNRLMAMHYIESKTDSTLYKYQTEHNNYSVTHSEKEIERRVTHTAGIIENSFFTAGLKSGLSNKTIMELVGVFGWDIDFALDIRSGDSFTVLYEERYLDGERLSDGEIIAAEFINQGRKVTALRHIDKHGHSNYYTPDGYSLRKAFIRSPVDFRRISSKFQRSRYHPVLGKKRPHRGVDYAAGTGTPIKASGDGKVIFKGTKGGYGRTIILQHGGKFTTLYGHMSAYKRGLNKGKRVKQGQIIGYVGKSGLATGPHLHYEFRVNGVHRNPLTVKFPNASPIEKSYRTAFREQAEGLQALIGLYRNTSIALN